MVPTVLSGAEERGAQRRSLALFLIFSIPANLPSFLRSQRLATMQYKSTRFAHAFAYDYPNWFCLQISSLVRSQKNLEIPAWPFFGTRQYCSLRLTSMYADAYRLQSDVQ